MTTQPPGGTVTFLFTDIEGSTDVAQAHPAAWETLRARHHALLTEVVQAHRGHVFKIVGDAFCVAFHTADDALRAAAAGQRALKAEPWAPAAIKVRMGLHTGEAQPDDRGDNAGDYVGYETLARVQRVMAAASGEQILLSGSCHALVQGRLPAGVALRDLGRHRLRGFAAPEPLWQVEAAGLRKDFPALASLAATPNNLPQSATRFIGRTQEVAECARLLAQSRLLTLTAIGGAGKTRLALEIARGELDHYPDGVWFVDLAQVQEGARVISSTAGTLGLREQPDTPLIDTVIRHLAARRTLVVLDNCEHVLGEVATLVEALLSGCTRMVVFATSREGLGVPGEQIFAVRSLRMPTGTDLDALRASEAVSLFMDRARLADPTLQLDAANGPVVADICRRLDGIALAIELAAARVKMLKLDDIRARLSDRFRLLTGGNRALPRQQTLLATLQWSYDQLTPTEQTLLRRLGVFVGGWTLPAATVLAGADADEFDVLETLTRLSDKSLIALDREPAEESRYTMVETVRQYALDRLEDAGETQQVRLQHAMFFVALAHEFRALERSRGLIAQWAPRIMRDHENLLAAHQACGLHDELAEPGLELVGALGHYWRFIGMFRLGREAISEALGRAGAQRPCLARCAALEILSSLELFLGYYDDALRSGLAALAIARSLHAKPELVGVLTGLSVICNAQGDLVQARVHVEEGLAIAQELGGRYLSRAYHILGELLRREGDLDGAERAYLESLAALRATGNPPGGGTLICLGLVAAQRDDAIGTRRHLVEALRITEWGLQSRMVLMALELCCVLASLRTEWILCARLHGAARTLATQIDFRHEPVDAMVIDPLVDRARAALGDAAFAAASAGGSALAMADARAEALAWLAAMQ